MKLLAICILAATTTLAVARADGPNGNAHGHGKKAGKAGGPTVIVGAPVTGGAPASGAPVTGAAGGIGSIIAIIPEMNSALIGLGVLGFCFIGTVRRRMAALPDSSKQYSVRQS